MMSDHRERRGPGDAEPSGRRPRSHPDIEALDAVAGGIGPRGAVRHVAGCTECTETVEALRGVRARLADLASVRMPDDVAARIGAALTGAQTPDPDLADPQDGVVNGHASDGSTGAVGTSTPTPTSIGSLDSAATIDPGGPGSPARPGGAIPPPATRVTPGRGIPVPRRSRTRGARPPRGPLVTRSLHAGGPPGRPDPRRATPPTAGRTRIPGPDWTAGLLVGGLAVCLLAVFAVAGVALLHHGRATGSESSSASSASTSTGAAGSAARGPSAEARAAAGSGPASRG
ncbi:MAG: hypothetical protein ACQSGP_28955, partial [Frankia sp.]